MRLPATACDVVVRVCGKRVRGGVFGRGCVVAGVFVLLMYETWRTSGEFPLLRGGVVVVFRLWGTAATRGADAECRAWYGRHFGSLPVLAAVFGAVSCLVAGYLVDPASSHMLVSKIKPCMSKYKRLVL